MKTAQRIEALTNATRKEIKEMYLLLQNHETKYFESILSGNTSIEDLSFDMNVSETTASKHVHYLYDFLNDVVRMLIRKHEREEREEREREEREEREREEERITIAKEAKEIAKEYVDESVHFIRTRTFEDAWKIARSIFPTDFMFDAERSRICGYSVYTSTREGFEDFYIDDLGERLEINMCAESVNVWIFGDDDDEERESEYEETDDEEDDIRTFHDIMIACQNDEEDDGNALAIEERFGACLAQSVNKKMRHAGCHATTKSGAQRRKEAKTGEKPKDGKPISGIDIDVASANYFAYLDEIRRGIRNGARLLENTARVASQAHYFIYNKNGDLKEHGTTPKKNASAEERRACRKIKTARSAEAYLIEQTLPAGFDLVHDGALAILEEKRKAKERGEKDFDFERTYSARKLKKNVWLLYDVDDESNAFEDFETSPVREAFRAVRRAVLSEKSIRVDTRNGYCYLEDFKTDDGDDGDGHDETIYRRLSKHSIVGGFSDISGARVASADDITAYETYDLYNEVLDNLKLTATEYRVLDLRMNNAGYDAIARNLGISKSTVRTHLARIQAKARAVGFSEEVLDAKPTETDATETNGKEVTITERERLTKESINLGIDVFSVMLRASVNSNTWTTESTGSKRKDARLYRVKYTIKGKRGYHTITVCAFGIMESIDYFKKHFGKVADVHNVALVG